MHFPRSSAILGLPMDFEPERYFVELAAAFGRGRLGLDASVDDADAIARAHAAGLRLHKFKRNAELPRVRKVLGILRGLAPGSLLDVGSGRGTFLWPLLDALPWVTVTAIDHDPRRAEDLAAVRRGGVARLTGACMDAARLAFDDRAFEVVSALEVLEHVPHPERVAAEIVRVARTHVVVSVPSTPDDNPEHLRLFGEADLRALLVDAGAKRVTFDAVHNHLVAVASVGS